MSYDFYYYQIRYLSGLQSSLYRQTLPGRLPSGGAGTVYVAAVHSTHVAAAGTIAQQADILAIVWGRQVVIGMTAGAIGLVCRERPCNDLVVGPVTVNTQYRCAVVTGIIRRVMPEQYQRCPGRRAMAAFTIQCGNEMGCRFAGCIRAVVAAQAKPGHQ